MAPVGRSRRGLGMSRTLIIIGALVLLVGLAWPWISKLGLGRLPGDIVVEKGDVRFYFPITTSIVVSLVLTLIFWLLKK